MALADLTEQSLTVTPTFFQNPDRGNPVFGFWMAHHPCERLARLSGQIAKFFEQIDLRLHTDPGFGQQGGGIGVRLIFILARQARGQHLRNHICDYIPICQSVPVWSAGLA